MTSYQDVVDAWDQADPRCIHPSRDESEESYWDSGRVQAGKLTAAFRAVGLHQGRVLDYGCGDGRVAIPMAAAGWSVVGADTSLRMVERLRENAGAAVDVAPVDDLPQVDAAYCLAVLIHHNFEGGRRIVAAIRDAVHLGGLVVLDWPTSSAPRQRSDWIDITKWEPSQRAAIERELGLQLIDARVPWAMYRRT